METTLLKQVQTGWDGPSPPSFIGAREAGLNAPFHGSTAV
jgi:hypothetical protein